MEKSKKPRNKKANIPIRKKDGEYKYFDVLEMNWQVLSMLTEERVKILYKETAF